MRWKIYLLLFTSLLLGTASCTRNCYWWESSEPQLVTINIIDRNEMSETITSPERLKQYTNVNFLQNQPYQKVLRVYSRNAAGDIPSYITAYHDNGQPNQYLEIINNRAYGSYKEWYPNGNLKIEAFVIGGIADITPVAEQSWLFDGNSCVWGEDGHLDAHFTYSKGELEGTTVYYHTDGSIWKSVPYHRNQVEGTFETYLENGQLLQTTEYREGVKHGESYRYWSSDTLAAVEEWEEGLLINATYYNKDGDCIATIENGTGERALFNRETVCERQQFHHGVIEGLVQIYDNHQRLVRSFHIRDGVKHGEEHEYFVPKFGKEQGMLKLLITWYDGKIQGTVKTWYPNGFQQSQREMSNNKKNGLLTGWYEDGNLMLIEEYDYDKLVKGEYYKKGQKFSVSEIRDGEGLATLFDADGSLLHKVNYINGRPLD